MFPLEKLFWYQYRFIHKNVKNDIKNTPVYREGIYRSNHIRVNCPRGFQQNMGSMGGAPTWTNTISNTHMISNSGTSPGVSNSNWCVITKGVPQKCFATNTAHGNRRQIRKRYISDQNQSFARAKPCRVILTHLHVSSPQGHLSTVAQVHPQNRKAGHIIIRGFLLFLPVYRTPTPFPLHRQLELQFLRCSGFVRVVAASVSLVLNFGKML